MKVKRYIITRVTWEVYDCRKGNGTLPTYFTCGPRIIPKIVIYVHILRMKGIMLTQNHVGILWCCIQLVNMMLV